MAPLGPAQRRVLFRDIARYLQKSQGQRIAAQQNPDGSAFEERKPRQKKNGIRQRAMFSRIRNRKHLKYRSSPNEAAVGFSGRIAQIANVHQLGLVAEVEKGGPLAKYAKRELLGLSDADISAIESITDNHLSRR